MNRKELKKYNQSRRRYHKLLAEELSRPVVNHILCKARKIQKLYRLEANATEEVEQELSIAAIKARDNWTPEMAAEKSTFVFAAINKHAAYLSRQLSSFPIMENCQAGTDMQAIGVFHKTSQGNAQRIYNTNNALYPLPVFADKKERIRQKKIRRNERPKIKPSVASCGPELARQAAARSVCDNALKMDIESVVATLTPRHQTIVNMLKARHTQEEIAEKIEIRQQRVSEQMQEIQKIFKKNIQIQR